jgi:Ca2+-binding RTX toxin-like protein
MSFVSKRGRAASAAAILALTGASLAAAISPASAVPPANDNIANAQAISGPIGSVNGTLTEATIEPGENAVNGVTPLRTVWYRWLPAHSGPVTLRTNNTNPNDPTMFLAVGTTIGQRTNANDDGVPAEPWFRDSKITFEATAGQIYSIGVGSFGGTQFTFTLNWNQTVPVGQTITGTGKKDVLNGTGGDDVIIGKGGNDIINGGGGNDTIIGGGGNDTIDGGFGNDVMNGGGGKDRFVAQDGFIDTVNGGGGKNRFISRDAFDVATKVKG